MADVLCTLTVRPESPETDTDAIQKAIDNLIQKEGGKVGKVEVNDMAFGLKELLVHFYWPEDKGSPDDIEQKAADVEGVQSSNITNVTRALG
ncbi:elongation factor 1-beta [Candidatus Woesearchaeota archaeon]|nr:elongation factor 1-beta [Candidatus Woesearchaeota archaeon]|tara:strand:- start:2403 stop:2678 length:276 start_codon:yes stop_codon:yes gene_type:complete